jgi:hypothetical protein
MTGTNLSFLLHPLDIIGGDHIRALAFFPGMDLKTDQKIRIFKKVISHLADHFQLSNMSKAAKHILKNCDLEVKNGNYYRVFNTS